MVVGAFPIAKLGMLGMKHISKPIGNLIKQTAKKNENFKKFVVSPPARLYHKIDVRSKMWMLGLGQPDFIPPLTEAMTIQMGGDILGELIIFLIGVFFIMGEVSRQAKKEQKKHEDHRIRREELESRIENLTEKVKHQELEINQLKRLV
ncbi:hypothetical protein KR074_012386 [Drosophila pseudoananassae]|nr:hypothetical protein KR074_012386 [Drosophila pseudoananassae]